MFRKQVISSSVFFLMIALLGACACSASSLTSAPFVTSTAQSTIGSGDVLEKNSATPVQRQMVETATPIVLTRVDSQDLTRPSDTECSLITRHDVAGFFSGEVVQPIYKASKTNQVPFSSDRVSANEYYCIYSAFHMSASANGTTYQLTYWVDMPNQGNTEELARAWTNSRLKAARIISGVGDDAFYDNGKLAFKRADIYVTIELLSTRIDTGTPAGLEQQLQLETTIATKASSRLG